MRKHTILKAMTGQNPDLLIMIGSKVRHKYFAIELARAFPSSAILVEMDFEDAALIYTKEPTPIIRGHFRRFTEAEERFFGSYIKKHEEFFSSKLVRQISAKTLNDEENVHFIVDLNPRVIAIHSTCLIGEKLIEAFPRRLINLHAGLSPYYRGSGTNVWPFYNGELECVGMTVHYIDAGIDSGDIILQGRPVFTETDDTHTIGCKNVILGTALVRRVIERYLREGPPPAFKQDKTRGRLYLKKQFTDEIVTKIEEFIQQGGVRSYMRNPKKVRLIDHLS